MGLFDLEKYFAYYGSYHYNSVNIFIHTLFVWPIYFTALILCYFTSPLISFSKILFLGHPLIFNFGFLLTVVYGLFYIGLDFRAGVLGAIICVGCWVFASVFASVLGFSLAWKVLRTPTLFFIPAFSTLILTYFKCEESHWRFYYPNLHFDQMVRMNMKWSAINFFL
ncbi:hypothetical protein DCAR_0236217 [Daucus carota subsp. sativus]|uniref:DUF962 domain-containing protein n=1 Tax=Daucus carota subsp. sativus TaxID=79200 RepID=A0AAF0WD42_DAUCS|nr:hypothetical protein DCAR_0236217 [Daucus carota subsp. sativus]